MPRQVDRSDQGAFFRHIGLFPSHHRNNMFATPLIAVVIITNGESAHLAHTFLQWCAEGFVPGRTIFCCGPRGHLLTQGINATGIIDYVDPPFYRNNFLINDKKRSKKVEKPHLIREKKKQKARLLTIKSEKQAMHVQSR